MREDYPYDEAINDLMDFFKERITDKKELNKVIIFLDKAREDKRVPMRHINVLFSNYLNAHPKDSKPLSKDEDRMLDDLMHFWG